MKTEGYEGAVKPVCKRVSERIGLVILKTA
jgi:hypothetical protein